MSVIKDDERTLNVACAKDILTAIQNHVTLTDDFMFVGIFIKDFIDEVGNYSSADFFQTLCTLYDIGYIRTEPFDKSTLLEKITIYDVNYKGYEFCKCAEYAVGISPRWGIRVNEINDWIEQITEMIIPNTIANSFIV